MEIVRIGTTVSRGYLLRKTKTFALWALPAHTCGLRLGVKKSVFIRENPCPKVQQERDMEIAATVQLLSGTALRSFPKRRSTVAEST